jgi:hypothetical protein
MLPEETTGEVAKIVEPIRRQRLAGPEGIVEELSRGTGPRRQEPVACFGDEPVELVPVSGGDEVVEKPFATGDCLGAVALPSGAVAAARGLAVAGLAAKKIARGDPAALRGEPVGLAGGVFVRAFVFVEPLEKIAGLLVAAELVK